MVDGFQEGILHLQTMGSKTVLGKHVFFPIRTTLLMSWRFVGLLFRGPGARCGFGEVDMRPAGGGHIRAAPGTAPHSPLQPGLGHFMSCPCTNQEVDRMWGCLPPRTGVLSHSSSIPIDDIFDEVG